MSKAEQLAIAIRRMQTRRREADAREHAKQEARAQMRHDRRIVRREKTGTLTQARIKACQLYPSRLAVRQLAGIARNKDIPSPQRVEAASVILRWGE